jgi:hypothetical protein
VTDKFGFEGRQLCLKAMKKQRKVSPALVLRCLFPQKRAGFASPFLLTEPAKSRVLLFDASLT